MAALKAYERTCALMDSCQNEMEALLAGVPKEPSLPFRKPSVTSIDLPPIIASPSASNLKMPSAEFIDLFRTQSDYDLDALRNTAPNQMILRMREQQSQKPRSRPAQARAAAGVDGGPKGNKMEMDVRGRADATPPQMQMQVELDPLADSSCSAHITLSPRPAQLFVNGQKIW